MQVGSRPRLTALRCSGLRLACAGITAAVSLAFFAALPARAVDSDGDGLSDLAEGSRVRTVGFGPTAALADRGESVFAADLDGDGDADALYASTYDDRIAWYENRLNEASADWSPAQVITSVADGARSVRAADLDGDGDLDVLGWSSYADQLAWYENRLNEAGAFGAQQIIATQVDAESLFDVDLDGDGKLDVLVHSWNDGTGSKVTWFENRISEPGPDFVARTIAASPTSWVSSVFPADLDGDGDPDIAATVDANHETVWLENRLEEPSANFTLRSAVPPFTQLVTLVQAADFDGDGDPDLLCASGYDDEVAWYANRLNEPVGGFGPKQVLSALVEGPVSLATGDLDGDGDPDVAIAFQWDHRVTWHENRLDEPSSDFAAGRVVSEGQIIPESVFAHDLDGDGDRDLLVGDLSRPIAWYENPGTDPHDFDSDDDGLGDSAEVNVHASDPNDPDSDGDGLGDGAEVNLYGTNPNAVDSDGDGLSDRAEIQVHGTNPTDPDTDGDELRDDFELRNHFDPHTAGEQHADPDVDGLDNLEEQALGTNPNNSDTDGDGLLDEAEAEQHGTDPTRADMDGDRLTDGFELAHGFDPFTPGEGIQDPDGDGLINVAEQFRRSDPHDADTDDDGVSDQVEVSRVESLGFGAQRIISHAATIALDVAAADLDRDGDADVLSGSRWDTQVAWYPNRLREPQADFAPQRAISGPNAADYTTSVFPADLDGDGDLDVLSASRLDGKIAWYRNRLDEPSGDFGPQQILYDVYTGPMSVVTDDLDGDGDLDVIAASFDTWEILWFENRLDDPSADFSAARIVSELAQGPQSVFAADFDGDGDPDVVSASSWDDEIAWYENRLDELSADFAPQRIISNAADGADAVLAVDLDGDGDLDVVSGSYYDWDIAWYENRLDEASANFAPKQIIYGFVVDANSIATADLDSDGDPDVLSSSYRHSEIAWFENRLDEATPGFGGKQVITTLARGAQAVSASDLDGDGDVDALSASSDDDEIAWYPNPGTDPTNPDTDGDGLGDGAELNTHGTDPTDRDSDNDGASDGLEIALGTDPNDAGRYPVAPNVAAIGTAGNPADATGFGAVGYAYQIGRFEVTVRDYVAFLNAVAAADPNGLFHDAADPAYGVTRSGASGSYRYAAIAGRQQTPVNFVSLYDAMRFVNWLANGQPEGAQDHSTTEDGAYPITPDGVLTNSIARLTSAAFALPNEDEWYKAAYYDPASQSYFGYPAGSSSSTTCSAPSSSPNRANCGSTVGSPTPVGSYPQAPSPSVTFDQGGNVWEWTDTTSAINRRIRGGSFATASSALAAAGSGLDQDPHAESADLGFRVLPEPGRFGSLFVGVAVLFALTRARSPRS